MSRVHPKRFERPKENLCITRIFLSMSTVWLDELRTASRRAKLYAEFNRVLFVLFYLHVRFQHSSKGRVTKTPKTSILKAYFMMTMEGTFTMISRVVVVRHLGGLLCAVGPMVSFF